MTLRIFLISCFIFPFLQIVSAQSVEAPANDSTVLRPNDSARINDMEKALQIARLNEQNLQMEIEQLRLQTSVSDSLKRNRLKQRIDSLRNVTCGAPVVVDADTLFTLYAKRGGNSAFNRAEAFATAIGKLGRKYMLQPDSVYIETTELVTDIMYENIVLATATDLDASWANSTRDELARQWHTVIVKKLTLIKEEHSLLQLGKRILFFILVLIGQYLLVRLTNYLYGKLKIKIIGLKNTRLRPISIHDYELFDTGKQIRLFIFLSNIGRYLIIFVQLLISIPILFAIFPQTENLALKIFSYLWNPVKSIGKGFVDHIPSFFTILVIYFTVRYVVKGIKYLSTEIENEKLKINGFYPDWAQPTYHIIRFLLYAFMIAMIYPNIPGSDSRIFQGISVFVGLVVSLGSSTVIGNIMAGLVITYMRPFKVGDRIKLNDTTGNVIEKTPFVTRLKTVKNELVTIPNSFIMSSHTTNYSSSARTFGLIVHTEVSIGYDAPWRKVHQLLIDAAKATPGISEEPEPFVLETSLSDWYPVYQINAYTSQADKLAQIYSDLHQNIQDQFNKAGVEIMSPHYMAVRDGNESTIPKVKQ